MRGDDARPEAAWKPPDRLGGYEIFVKMLTSLDLRRLVLDDARIALWVADHLDAATLQRLLVPIRQLAADLDIDPETVRRATRSEEIDLAEAVPYGQAMYWRIHAERWRVQREINPPPTGGGRNWIPPKESDTLSELESQLVDGKGTRSEQVARIMSRLREGQDKTRADAEELTDQDRAIGRSGITGSDPPEPHNRSAKDWTERA